MTFLSAFFKEFLSLTWMVLPYFLGGAAFGAALDVFLKPEHALKHLRGGWLSMTKAAVLGMVMPGCSCATMPMAEGLRRKGADLGTVECHDCFTITGILSVEAVTESGTVYNERLMPGGSERILELGLIGEGRAFQLVFRNVNGSHFTIDGGVELIMDMQRRVL